MFYNQSSPGYLLVSIGVVYKFVTKTVQEQKIILNKVSIESYTQSGNYTIL